MSGTVFTIGYQGLSPDEFFGLLREAGVEVLIDVRAVAWSRKPGFSKRSLQEKCASEGMEYYHFPALGIPTSLRESIPDREALLEIYRTEILPEHENEVREVARLCGEKRCALMCMEEKPEECHRKVLAERIAGMIQAEVVHLTMLSMHTNREGLE